MLKKSKTLLVAIGLSVALSITVSARTNAYNVISEPIENMELMADANGDFRITEGVLNRYNGPGGSVVIPKGVTRIGFRAFAEKINVTSVTIPDGVTSIDFGAFENTGITNITIPKSVTEISNYDPFSGCKSLATINVDPENKEYSSVDGVLFNKNKTKLIKYPIGNKNTSYSIPNGVLIIGSNAFRSSNSLTSVVIPNSVTEIEHGAFALCRKLLNINIQNGVRIIGNNAFFGCINLTKLVVPDSVSTINEYAFIDCTNLSDIIIPKNINNIGDCAFDNTEWIENYKGDFVIVGDGVLAKYKGDKTNIMIPENVKSISGQAFFDCKIITSVTIPETVIAMDPQAFLGRHKVGSSSYVQSNFDVTISGKANSYAEEYAKNNDLKFNSIGVANYKPSVINVSSSERIFGDNRYKTAVETSRRGWAQADNVILVSGENHTDALVSSSFAYLKNAPILITPSKKLDKSVANELNRLQTKTIYIIGNTSGVSKEIEESLKMKYTVVRIGGITPQDTALKVAEEVRKIKPFSEIAIVNSADFPDSLAMAPFSATNTIPILFHDAPTISDIMIQTLEKWNIYSAYILGGTSVVSEKVENDLRHYMPVTRLSGKDRYDTSLEIIKNLEPMGGYRNISIVSGENYPDALTAAMLSAKLNTPMVIVSANGFKDNVLQYLNAKRINKAYIFGGETVVPKDITTN